MITTNILNCVTSAITTFFDGCAVKVEDLRKVILFHPSVKIDLTTDTLDNATLGLLIKKKLIYVFDECEEITQNDIKSNIKTYKNKMKAKISDGLYEFMLQFLGNDCLEKSMRKLEGRNWKICFVDAEGKFWFDNKGGKIQGFDLKLWDVSNTKIGDGASDNTNFSVDTQLSIEGSLGFNTRRAFVTAETFDFMELNGVQDCKLDFVTKVATNFVVSVVAGCDGSTPIEGLTATNFKLVKASDSSVVTPTVVSQGNGRYKISSATPLTAVAYTLQLFDVTNSLPVTDILNTQFFQSNLLAVVLT